MLGKPAEGPERKRTRKGFLTYISCVVHKNAAFATFHEAVLCLASKRCGRRGLRGDPRGSGRSSGSHGDAGPAPPRSFCTTRERGGPRGRCSCVPAPGAEVMARWGIRFLVSWWGLTRQPNRKETLGIPRIPVLCVDFQPVFQQLPMCKHRPKYRAPAVHFICAITPISQMRKLRPVVKGKPVLVPSILCPVGSAVHFYSRLPMSMFGTEGLSHVTFWDSPHLGQGRYRCWHCTLVYLKTAPASKTVQTEIVHLDFISAQ